MDKLKRMNNMIENQPKIPDNANMNALPNMNHNHMVKAHFGCPLINCPRVGIKKLSIAANTCLSDGEIDMSFCAIFI